MRLSEIYVSLQGEGPKVGLPTIFVRLAGCNLRCPGWACDTPYAIFPEKYRKEWLKLTAEELLAKIRSEPTYSTVDNICITGGEPFLQPYDELEEVCRGIVRGNGKTVEFFSNGTIEYPEWVNNCNVVMDWKLSGSGEKLSVTTRQVMELNYRFLLRSQGNAIKFTISNRDDFDEAIATWKRLSVSSVPLVRRLTTPFFCGPVWGKLEPRRVAEWIIEAGVPWKLNLQTHKYVYGDVRGI